MIEKRSHYRNSLTIVISVLTIVSGVDVTAAIIVRNSKFNTHRKILKVECRVTTTVRQHKRAQRKRRIAGEVWGGFVSRECFRKTSLKELRHDILSHFFDGLNYG